MNGIGERIQRGRKRRNLTIEEVSRRTKVDPEFIEAIEAEAWERLPPGPYTDAWVRAICSVVHIKPPQTELEIEPERGLPLWVPRVLGIAAVFLVIVLIGWIQLSPLLQRAAPKTAKVATPQVVELYARRTVKIRVEADGEEVFTGVLPGEGRRTFEARERLEIDVPSVEAMRFEVNGISVIPQGRQDAPRKLIFIDDAGS